MSPHIKPIIMLVAGYLIIATVLIVPRIIRQYRHSGSIKFSKKATIMTLVIYLIVTYIVVSLPIHNDYQEKLAIEGVGRAQLRPFEILKALRGSSEEAWVVSAFYQMIFDTLMMVPLGIYYYVLTQKEKKSWLKIAGIGFLVSLFFELSQLTGIFGLQAKPIRLFNVDDLWLNTLGAIIGYGLAPGLLFFMPDWKIRLADAREYTNADYTIQMVELYLTILIANILAIFTNSFIGTGGPWFKLTLSTIFYFIISVAMPRFFEGKTLGGLILNVKLIPDKTKRFCPYMVRMVLIFVPLWFNEFAVWICSIPSVDNLMINVQVIFFFVTMILWIIIYFDIIMKWLKGAAAPYYNEKSGIKVEYNEIRNESRH
ncbi:VanZ family protein [Vagococcus fessus]|uniref:VanZ-like domain-containing protein n=1 Tax=Vagococcus fessus TaxID=120370 RepID=A0A430A4M5_9ENTE|nr:VanZ family protein [Vagococcus fessus]RSU01639.1 hypothetical protein CBF31_10460 [Vagococcus fessus]